MENQINTEPNNSLPEPVLKKGFLSTLSKRQKTSLFTLVALLVILPVTTALALLATRLNSRAYLPSTPPTPPITVTVTPSVAPTSTPSATPVVCKNPLVGFTTSKLCNITSYSRTGGTQTTTQGYLEATITCQNGYKEKYTSPKCLDAASLKTYAAKVCEQKATCPTPVKNSLPRIETSTLKPSIKNRDYQEIVIATDADKGDTVTMSATGLPANLKLVCVGKALGRATCQITGIPEKVGQFTVVVTARDNKGGTTTKNFTFKVLPANTR